MSNKTIVGLETEWSSIFLQAILAAACGKMKDGSFDRPFRFQVNLSNDDLQTLDAVLQNKEGSMPKKEDLIYFLSLELENVRCFGAEKQTLNLSDEHGNPVQWTLLLGENGLGKTTLSECLLWMQFVPSAGESPKRLNNPDEGITRGPMEPSLPEAANDLIESFIRIGCEKLDIKAKFSQGIPLGKTLSKNKKSLPIKTGINVFFKDQKLENYIISEDDNSKIEDILGGKYKEPFIITYGASRAIGNISIYVNELEDEDSRSNFLYKRLSERTELYNAQEILRYFETKALKSREKIPKNGNGKETPEELLYKDFKQIIVDILPIDEINIKDIKIDDGLIYLNTFSGKNTPFSALSLGYQTTICLAIDIAWRLYQKYPKGKPPRTEPAIILIDEIDLHLHPLWQRKFIDKLVNIFSGSQFIVTTHSPLIVQAAAVKPANLAVLRREGNHAVIDQSVGNVRGWRVDQILTSDLFDLPGYGLDIKTEELLAQRKQILLKAKLTGADEKRLKELEAQIGFLPIMENPKYDAAMDIILRAAEKLGKGNL